jgi:DNA polymerase-3 subunit gamma/tau
LNLLEVSEAEAATLKEQAALASTESLTRILEVLADAELRLRDATSKKILMEVTLLKAIEARSAVSLDSVLKQLNQLRGQTSPGGTPAPKQTEAAPVAERRLPARREPESRQQHAGPEVDVPIPVPATVATASPVSADLTELWTRLIEAVGRASPFTRSYLVDANPVSFEKNILTIGFDPEFEDHLGLVDNSRNHALLQTKLAELGQPNAQIKFVKVEASVGRAPQPARVAPATPVATAKSDAPATREKSAAVPFNKNDFKNDPLIQRALEIFKGQIVEVRA